VLPLLAFYHRAIGEELLLEEEVSSRSDALLTAISQAPDNRALSQLWRECRELGARYFRRRASVPALCQLMNRLHDAVLERIVTSALEVLQGGGRRPGNLAVLVTGARGRREEALSSSSGYLLVAEAGTHERLVHALATALTDCHLGHAPQLWHGTEESWRKYLQHNLVWHAKNRLARPFRGETHHPSRLYRLFAEVGDLSFLLGNRETGIGAVQEARQALADALATGAGREVARQIATLPVPLGFLGHLRVDRDGPARGQLDLEQGALGPLRDAVRLLALRAGVMATGTVQRVRALQQKGVLDEELARRVLEGYLVFMEEVVAGEVEGAHPAGFLKAERLEGESGQRIRKGLEGVLALQKVLHQSAGYG